MAAELTDEQIEAAAKVLARYSDTPWAMLPETSKMKARTVAGEIIRAALSTLPSATGAEDAEPAMAKGHMCNETETLCGRCTNACEAKAPQGTEPAGIPATIHEQSSIYLHATLRAPKLCEFTLEAVREDTTRDWRILLTDEGGYRLYDGYWRDSAHKSRAEVLVEAARGACLSDLARPNGAAGGGEVSHG